MREMLAFLSAVAFVALLEGARQLYRFTVEKKKEELRRRLRAIADPVAAAEGTLLRAGRVARNPAVAAFLKRLPFTARLEQLIEQADSQFSVAQVSAWSAMLAAAGAVLAGWLRMGLGLGGLLSAAGLALPTLLLVVARDRRSNRLSEQLPEALDMMARSLRAGHAFTSAFEVVATEMPEPVAVEFARAFESQRLGLPVEQAIVQMTERAPGNRDLRIFAVSALIQKETGGNLAEILGSIAETIRARYRFYSKLSALTAEGRASGAILGMLPILMALVLRIMNPAYMGRLVSDPLGHMIMLFAALSWLVGVAWLYSLTKVDL
ncbi:type II secretion system protein [Anaeromyxobacter dehalogenans 2CP-1]|uniref:Type II secretion system protein n=1 Tax=Anaeromyxobacter dehalogenans (strain ATCC BAA-258 / DSM 21875 / 2CP-1) TaxID=455488 RepID=B8JFG8_ANAD2|nr:type II secretion system F family protein [Anaeromyxobacter dehalogenans]ACL66345.1 type II secretion system protein [Anaeromyxobacter dehalogenans 2CP-1]